jgi:hypothetical protein
MDCWRAQRRFDKIEELWTELAQSSPSGALVTEGRIVLAGACPDAGRLQLDRDAGRRPTTWRSRSSTSGCWYGRPLRTRRARS